MSMSLLGNVELKTTELRDALEFTVSREDGLIETIVVPVGAFVVVWMFWRIGALWPRLIAILSAVSMSLAYFANWIQGGETNLRVTREGLFAEGNLGNLFSTSVTVAIEDVSSIGYWVGPGEDGPSGLYARGNWQFWMLLPHLSREDAETVVATIQKKFPFMPSENTLSSSMFGDGGKLISLGLSNLRRDGTNGKQ
jgi:hypothetical protein